MSNNILTLKRVKKLAYLMAGLFLAIHIVMFVVFSRYGVTPMARFNIFSIVFYTVMLLVTHQEWFLPYALLTFLEINLHMGLAVYYVGWNGGFQITLIAIVILLFYSEYIGCTMRWKYLKSILFAPVAMLTYLAGLLIDLRRPAPYTLPDAVNAGFQIAWALIVFGIVIMILQIFVYVTTRSQRELSNEVLHDKLTELPNRYYMSDFFKTLGAVDSEDRYWVAIADLDDFKQINDTRGHNCGDYVLKTVAGLMRGALLGMEICRWGGEEFLIAGHKAEPTPKNVLEHVRRTIECHPFEYEGKAFHITVTIGMAWFQPGQSIDEWIDAADKKLYEGKTRGKNRVVG